MISNNIFFIFIISFVVEMITIPVLIGISKKTNFLVDVPEGDVLKIHKKNIPLSGGLTMIICSLIGVIIFWVQGFVIKIAGVFAGLLIIFLLGFYDDLKWKHISTIKPLLKFTLLILCTFVPSVILWYVGISFIFFPAMIISILLGFVYIFLCINAVNYQDGMDGLAGGLAGISLGGFIILGITFNALLPLYISVLFLGTVLAFLCFNFPPAKVFMGDSGAYSLGFILAVLAMLFSKPYNIYSILGPLFIIGLPIFDGVFTNIRRLAAGRSIFLGDRYHFYDKLLQKGFSTKKTLTICYFIQTLLVFIGVSIYV